MTYPCLVKKIPIPIFPVWNKIRAERKLISFDLEFTKRCNSKCRHCYINMPVNDRRAMDKELTVGQIEHIADEAISMGALWCLITGGEPLVRQDFFDVYLSLKRRGMLVSVFTNATLLTKKHIRLFKKYPARHIEVTVYGITQETYEQVTQVPGSFKCFMRGLSLLFENNVKVRLKTTILRSNVHELPKIARFCRKHTKDYFRYDPFLNLRLDADHARNEEIKSERLSPSMIYKTEQEDADRLEAFQKKCEEELINPGFSHKACNHIFRCGAGNSSFTVSSDGIFRLCSSLCHPDCIYDLKKGSLKDAWHNFVPKIQGAVSKNKEFLRKCKECDIVNLCMWCPAHSYLETGELDGFVQYFCDVAYARKTAILNSKVNLIAK